MPGIEPLSCTDRQPANCLQCQAEETNNPHQSCKYNLEMESYLNPKTARMAPVQSQEDGRDDGGTYIYPSEIGENGSQIQVAIPSTNTTQRETT